MKKTTQEIQTLNQLLQGQQFLENPERWCKENFRNALGQRCIIGACTADASGMPFALMRLLYTVVNDITKGGEYTFGTVSGFNDHPQTTHAMIMIVLAEAVRRAREAVNAA